MSLSLTTIFPTLLLAVSLALAPSAARQLRDSTTMLARLKADENSTTCWDSMFKVQACTGEVVQFFYNGEAYLGPECCHAVHVVAHDCWPTMLGSLGFTREEDFILRGYCDLQEDKRPNSIIPSPINSSPPQAVGPTVLD